MTNVRNLIVAAIIISAALLFVPSFYQYQPEKFAPTGLGAPKSYAADHGSLIGVDISSNVKVINPISFKNLLEAAKSSDRKRKMVDLTKRPTENSMQVLMNTWLNGSFSPVHRHPEYSEAFVVIDGSLAFFTFDDGGRATCNVLSVATDNDKAIIVEKNTWHAMTAMPSDASRKYPGHAIIFEISGHIYDPSRQTKELAHFAPSKNNGLDGDPLYFTKHLLPKCRVRNVS